MRAILQIEIKFHITRLVDEINASIFSLKLTWAQATDSPTSYRVGSARKIPLLKGQNLTVSIRISYAQSNVSSQSVVLIKLKKVRIVNIHLGVLGICDSKHRVLAIGVGLKLGYMRQ